MNSALFKKLFSVILALAMAAALLSACGKESDDDAAEDVKTEEKTEKGTESETEAKASAELTEERAAEILLAYSRTNLFGLYVEFDRNYEPVNVPEKFEYYGFYKVANFKTVEEGRELTKKYMSDEVYEKISRWEFKKDSYFNDGEALVYATMGHGIWGIDSDSIKVRPSGQPDRAFVFFDYYDETDEYEGTYSFAAECVDGEWIMTASPLPAEEYYSVPAEHGKVIW